MKPIKTIEEALEAEKQGRLGFVENGVDGTDIKISQSLVHAVSGWIEQGLLVWKPEEVELVEWGLQLNPETRYQRTIIRAADDAPIGTGGSWVKTGRTLTGIVHEGNEDE